MKVVKLFKGVPAAALCFTLILGSNAVYAQNSELGSNQTAIVVDSSQTNFFLSRVEAFRQSIIVQVQQVFIPQVQAFKHLSPADKNILIDISESFLEQVDKKTLQYQNDYRTEFVTIEKNEGAKTRLLEAESDIKWAVEKGLNAMVQILDGLDAEKSISQLKKSKSVIEDVTRRMEANERMSATPGDLLKNLAPVKKGLVKTICSAITRICFNQNISKMIRDLPAESFSRESLKNMEIEVISKDGQRQEGLGIPRNAAVVFAMNHDHAILDLKSIQILADKFGIERNMVLTTTDAWPHAKVMGNRDPNIMFIQEKGLAQKVVDNMKAHTGSGPIAFTIYPEGQLPFWGTQFPLYAKFGAFIIARKAAIALKEQRPVYYIEVHSNFLKSITSEKSVPLKLQVIKPQLVPTEPMTERDVWAEQMRTEFEARANTENKRGAQYDLINRKKIPGTLINTTVEVRPMISCQGLF